MGFKRIGSLLARDVSETTFGCTTAYYIVIRGGTHKTDTCEDDDDNEIHMGCEKINDKTFLDMVDIDKQEFYHLCNST